MSIAWLVIGVAVLASTWRALRPVTRSSAADLAPDFHGPDAIGYMARARHREERQEERTRIWCQRNAEVRAQLLEGWPTSDADSDELTDANDMGRAA